jgi:hypothetical protein
LGLSSGCSEARANRSGEVPQQAQPFFPESVVFALHLQPRFLSAKPQNRDGKAEVGLIRNCGKNRGKNPEPWCIAAKLHN